MGWAEALRWAMGPKLRAHHDKRNQERDAARAGGVRRPTRPLKIPITIEFELLPSGKVYCSPNSDGTMREVTDPSIRMLVHAAYRLMSEEARKLYKKGR